MTGDCPGAAQACTGAGHLRDIATGAARPARFIFLGVDEWLTGNYPGAARDLQEALDIARNLGDQLVTGQRPYLAGSRTGDVQCFLQVPGRARIVPGQPLIDAQKIKRLGLAAPVALDIARNLGDRLIRSTPLPGWEPYGR